MRRIHPIAIAVLATLAGGPAAAQDPAPTGVLEEIIVTAQKREQSLQDVGIAVTAFTGDQIRRLGFTNTTDIVAMTPGLSYTVPNAESSQINFFLRGVGLNDFADANENPVAVYVDDVYRPAMGGLSFQLFDMERVEVLRGPQGTLFGRNTTGGLVHYVSRRPTEEPDGYVNATFGEFSQVKLEGALGGRLTDTLAGRLSLATNQHDGWTENRVGPDYNETDSRAARAQLLFTPTDDIGALFIGWWSDNDASVGAWQHQSTKINAEGLSVPLGANEQDMSVDCNADGALDAGDLRPTPGTDCFGYRDTDGDPWAGDFDRDGRVVVETRGLSANVDWELENFTVTSITAFQTVERLQTEDTDAGPFPLLQPTFAARTDTFTQELHIDGGGDDFRWLAGLYYFDNEVDGDYILDLTNLGFVFFDVDYLQETDSLAVFGQVEYDLADQWTLIAGARLANEEKTLDYLNVDRSGLYEAITGSPIAFDFSPATVGDLARHDNDSVSGKLELDWRPHDDLLVYGSVSQGTKSAGFNVGFLDQTLLFASNTAETIPFGDETLRSYEVGFKSTLFDGRARFNGSAFYYDYQDFQTFRFELLNQVIFNTDAEVSGAEFELQASPAEGWDVALGLSLLDATAKNIPDPAGGPPRDRTMVAAPEVSANALVRYAWPAFGGELAVQAWGNYQGETFYDIQNVPVSREDGYTVGNLRASYTSGDERWEVAAFAHNVTEEEYLSYSFDFTGTFGFNQQAFGAPRWIGVSLQYNLW
ncbi:MAG TPA: TonB-dependent receptor [Woeseiaceae bacterium]|nr:TonB-dependent receptor [Woeseiaceae bacterium]